MGWSLNCESSMVYVALQTSHSILIIQSPEGPQPLSGGSVARL